MFGWLAFIIMVDELRAVSVGVTGRDGEDGNGWVIHGVSTSSKCNSLVFDIKGAQQV